MAALNLQNQEDEPNQIENKFLVPYQANPRFIGRTQFLQTLKEKLSDVAPKRDNHRIALYGMGGIGKTQCALGYVYANRDVYDRIYWITAVDRTSLLSGYQSIAKAARLHYLQNASSTEIADAVLSWLRQQQSWLLVIDNLDDIQVANSLLPENGSQKHTIITTRNPNAKGIPAEPLEVPLLNADDSIDLLSTLSDITVQPDSAEEHQAAEIVQKLGYLPLAIEQAAAYVREVTADFSAFLEEYERNHKKLHMWVPAGNRQYPNSIATTWSMSFSLLQKYPVKLLRLFSFLNPDGILIAFLVSGAEALEDDLRHIIVDQSEMATALLELEKFSLIKWDRPNKSITIHRLVQMVVRDEMSDEELRSTLTNIIDLCIQAFPKFTTNETRSLCRTYQGQIVEPLLRMKTIHTSKSALIRKRVGEFLREDGKYDDSEKLLLQAVEIYTSLLGTENSETLFGHAHPRLDVSSAGKKCRCGQDSGGSVGEAEEDIGRRAPAHAHGHARPRLDISSAGKKCRCGQDSGGSVGEGEEDIGRRAPGHAHGHACPRLDISSAGKKCRCGQDSGGSVGEGEEDIGRRAPGHAHGHACPRLDISSAGKKCRCGQDSGGSVGEAEEDIGRRAPGHAHGHAQPRLDISSAGKKCRCGQDSGGSVGEARGGYWEKSTRTRSRPCTPSP